MIQQTSIHIYISLCPTSKDDHKLHVRGLPDLTIGPGELEIESDEFDGFVDKAEMISFPPL